MDNSLDKAEAYLRKELPGIESKWTVRGSRGREALYVECESLSGLYIDVNAGGVTVHPVDCYSLDQDSHIHWDIYSVTDLCIDAHNLLRGAE